MTPRAIGVFSLASFLALIAVILTTNGCATAVTTTGKVLTTTASASGKIAGAAAKTTGKVATRTASTALTTSGQVVGATARTTGSLVKSGVNTTVSLAKVPLVTLKDTTTSIIKQVPWTEGMKLYAASKTAEFDTYMKAFAIFRAGGAQVIRSDWRKIKAGAPEPELQPGDFVEIRQLPEKIQGKGKI